MGRHAYKPRNGDKSDILFTKEAYNGDVMLGFTVSTAFPVFRNIGACRSFASVKMLIFCKFLHYENEKTRHAIDNFFKK